MILKSLTVEQYRGFINRTTLDFDAHFTVIVGENGVGKTSMLWALRVLLSQMLSHFGKNLASNLKFQANDIAMGWPYLRAEATVLLQSDDGATATCHAQKNAAEFVPNTIGDGRPREHAVNTPDSYQVVYDISASPRVRRNTPPALAVYYSAHRSLALERGPSKARIAAGIKAAYAKALEDRELRLREAALLWRKEEALEESDDIPARANRSIEKALPAFLGEFRNLRVEGEDKLRLVVDKRGTKLDLSLLSDGERGLLAVLMDLTRRLSQANPNIEDPAHDGQAIVLIDELDLHMHPRWQRQIVPLLTETFPNCQFITTTHSPQIISEVQPESLLLLRFEQNRIVPKRCGQAYGLDVNYVLEHIMGTAPRAEPATQAIHTVEDALEIGDLDTARLKLQELRELIHGDDPIVVGLEATINNLEALGNATDSEED